MKNKSFAIVLALMLIGATSAWATGLANGLGQPGGHVGNHGCFLCHTPHSKGAILVATTSNSGLAGSGLGLSLGAGVTAPATYSNASTGQPVAGNMYLWANPLTQTQYTTWEGTTISAPTSVQTPAIHSILCLSCHDASMGDAGAARGCTLTGTGCLGGLQTTPTGNPAYLPPNMNGIGQVFWTGNSTNNGWASTGSLQATHPVDVAWPNMGGAGSSAYWIVNVSGTTATFQDTTFPLGDGNTGHPAKLYVSSGTAYVECTSCHEPHRYASYAYQQAPGGTWYFGQTFDYLRGPANCAGGGGSCRAPAAATNGSMYANFCRSCHYEKSMAYINAGGAMN